MIRIFQYGEVPNETLFIRSPLIQDVAGVVEAILADVRRNGDEALFRLTEKFDGAKLDDLLVSDAEIKDVVEYVKNEGSVRGGANHRLPADGMDRHQIDAELSA